MKPILLIIVLAFTTQASAQYPDGTIVMSNKPNTLVGRIAKRIAGGDHYTHIGVVIDGYVYESDWPRAKRTPVGQYGNRRTVNDYYVPTVPLNVEAMRAKANSMVGQRYQLRNYLNPNSPKTQGTWCSPFAGQILNAGGYNLTPSQYYEPQNIINAVRSQYQFRHQVRR